MFIKQREYLDRVAKNGKSGTDKTLSRINKHKIFDQKKAENHSRNQKCTQMCKIDKNCETTACRSKNSIFVQKFHIQRLKRLRVFSLCLDILMYIIMPN